MNHRQHGTTKTTVTKAPFSLASPPFTIRSKSSQPSGYRDRRAVVVSVPVAGAKRPGGKRYAFYQSTGRGSPGLKGASTGDWVPFNGISRGGGGWFIKLPGKAPTGTLAEASQWLARQHLGRSSVIFDERDHADHDVWLRDVNTHLARYGALYGGADHDVFQRGTVNVKETPKMTHRTVKPSKASSRAVVHHEPLLHHGFISKTSKSVAKVTCGECLRIHKARGKVKKAKDKPKHRDFSKMSLAEARKLWAFLEKHGTPFGGKKDKPKHRALTAAEKKIPKRERQFKHVLEGLLAKKVPLKDAKRIAAAVVNKQRAKDAKSGRGPKLVGKGGSRRQYYPGKKVTTKRQAKAELRCLTHHRTFKSRAGLASHYRSHKKAKGRKGR